MSGRLAYDPDKESDTLEVPNTDFDPDFDDFGDNTNETTQLTQRSGKFSDDLEAGSTTTENSDGTYAAPPSTRESPTMAPLPEMQYDEMHVVEHPEEYQRFQYLQKQQSFVKGLTIIHLFYSIISIVTWSWLYVIGGISAPLGFYAAHKWKKMLMLIYTVVFGIELIVHLIISFTKTDPAPTGWILTAVLVGALGRVAMTWFFYKFWRVMPHNVAKAFEKFMSNAENFEDFIMP